VEPQFAQSSPRGGTPLRVITLLLVLSTLVAPAIMSSLPPTSNESDLQRTVLATLEVFVGFFALLGTVAGRASARAKVGGVLFALGYITLAMIEDFTTIGLRV
jgi:hypothetical protein